MALFTSNMINYSLEKAKPWTKHDSSRKLARKVEFLETTEKCFLFGAFQSILLEKNSILFGSTSTLNMQEVQ